MGKPPVRAGSVVLVIEVAVDRHPEGCVLLVTSLPGREGTLTRSWRCPGGRPDEHQVADLCSVASRQLLDCLLLSGIGIQGSLI